MASKKPTTDTSNSREANASLLSVEEKLERFKVINEAYSKINSYLLEVANELELDNVSYIATLIFLRDGITDFLRERNIDHLTILD